MSRADRLFQLLGILHDGRLHRAADLATRLGVSQRSIYRDVDTLAKSGAAITGTRGSGYRLGDEILLPPLKLAPPELEALHLALAIVAESSDPDLSAHARTLVQKIDAALPEEQTAPADAWKTAALPAARAARSFSHLPALRSAIRARQKLQLTETGHSPQTIRPLRLENWGRNWILTGWSETSNRFAQIRTDLIETATPLPELFVDEPGRQLSDFNAAD